MWPATVFSVACYVFKDVLMSEKQAALKLDLPSCMSIIQLQNDDIPLWGGGAQGSEVAVKNVAI